MNYEEFKQDDSQESTLTDRLAEVVSRRDDIETKIKKLKKDLELEESILKNIDNNIIPTMLDGIQGDLKMKDGRILSISDKIRSSMRSDSKQQALQWIDDNGFGHIVKRKSVLEFGRDQEELAKKVNELLKEQDFGHPLNLVNERSVHWQTLDALVRDRLKEGEEMPKELFNVYVQKIVKVKD